MENNKLSSNEVHEAKRSMLNIMYRRIGQYIKECNLSPVDEYEVLLSVSLEIFGMMHEVPVEEKVMHAMKFGEDLAERLVGMYAEEEEDEFFDNIAKDIQPTNREGYTAEQRLKMLRTMYDQRKEIKEI